MTRTLPRSPLPGLFVLFVVVPIVVATGAVSLPAGLAPTPMGASSLHATDLNADGAPDLLAASKFDDTITWYRNIGGEKYFSRSERTVITRDADGVQSVYAADLDGDGDQDVLSASSNDETVAWYENTDGYGSFSSQKVIDDELAGVRSVVAADLDGDTDTDLLAAGYEQGKVVWYENIDGQGTFSSENVISTDVEGVREVAVADLDGDGDKDVLSASSTYGGANKIAWYRNTSGGFASQNVISDKVEGARSVHAADLDGDDDQDVLSGSADDGTVAWYENTSGYGTFSKQKVISSDAGRTQAVLAADVDGDNDPDVLSASSKSNGKIAWYENTDGQGAFPNGTIITAQLSYSSLTSADLDGDGDPDLPFGSEKDDQIGWSINDIEQGEGFSSPQILSQNLTGSR